MGYELVRVLLQGRQNLTLQVMAERRDRQPMTVDDCAEISRSISAILDVEDPITGAYTLEVSSPGIDRPLTRPQDFERFAGFDAKVETVQPVEGPLQQFFPLLLYGAEGGEDEHPYLATSRDSRQPAEILECNCGRLCV